MLHEEKEINSISEFVNSLKNDIPKNEKHVWYRGQANTTWKLIPSLGRKQKHSPQLEYYLIKRFRQNATQLVHINGGDYWDWLLLMQHHGVPTRLLDWTENPLIGLFFAINEKPNKTAAIWMLLPSKLNKLCNIIPQISYDIPSFDDPVLGTYSIENLVREDSSHLKPIAVIVPRSNPRMQAQMGVFTVMHRDPIPVEDIEDKSHIWKYIIPAASKAVIKKELKILGINKFSIFPELSSIGEMVTEELK